MANLPKERMLGAQFKGAQETLEMVFDILHRSYMEQLVESEFHDVELREECYRMIKTLDNMTQIFTKVVSAGELAAGDIELMAKIDRGEVKEFH